MSTGLADPNHSYALRAVWNRVSSGEALGLHVGVSSPQCCTPGPGSPQQGLSSRKETHLSRGKRGGGAYYLGPIALPKLNKRIHPDLWLSD